MAVARTVASPTCGRFAAGIVTGCSVVTLTPSLPCNTVPAGSDCGVALPLYTVNGPVAALALWWPYPVVAAVADRVTVTGARVRVGTSSVVVICAGYVLA